MTCKDIKTNLKIFLDDLLSEEEYQAFVTHLDQCTACQNYVGAVGSFSNHLRELGNAVKVPPDFSSTVFFKLKEPEQVSQSIPIIASRKTIAWTTGIVLIILGLFSGINHFVKNKHRAPPAASPPSVSTPTKKEQKNLYQGEIKPVIIEWVAEDTGNEPTEKKKTAEAESNGKEVPTKKEALTEKIPFSGNSSKKAPIPISKPELLHWHFLFSKEEEKTKLEEISNLFSIKPDYETSDILVLAASGEKLEQVRAVISLIASLRSFNDETRISSNREYRVFIYLEKSTPEELKTVRENTNTKNDGVFMSLEKEPGAKTGSLHWHFFLTSTQSALLNTIRELGGSIEYQSEEMLVLSIPGRQVKKLIEWTKTTEGVLADFGETNLIKEETGETRTIISIYFLPEESQINNDTKEWQRY
ncbi:MAG: zf-HC2 domain-containing protein [Candidatus Omnitrophota bacterium]